MIKKAGKIASVITAIMLMGCSPFADYTLPSYAAEQSAYTQSYVKVPENTLASNGMFAISYDPEKINVENVQAGKMFDGTMNGVNIKDGKITFAFVSAKPINIGGNILKIIYENKNGSNVSSPFSLKIHELITFDNGGKELNIDAKNISVTEGSVYDVPDFKVSASDPDANNISKVTIGFPQNTGVTNGIITVMYDNKKMKFSKGNADDSLKNTMFEFNESSDGIINIAFISLEKIDSSNSISLDFVGYSDCTTQIIVDVEEFLSTDITGVDSSVPVKRTSAIVKVSGNTVSESKYDINNNGSVSAADIMVMKMCMYSPSSVKPESLKKADLNSNGIVNMFDLIRLKQYLLLK